MVLISCPECEKDISDKASACPGCGVPISNINKPPSDDHQTTVRPPSAPHKVKTTRGGGIWEGVGFILIVAGMLIGMATGDDNHIGGLLGGIGFVAFIIGRFN